MKFALLMSNGETVALASRLISVGASACTAQTGSPLPSSDWLLIDESTPLSSPQGRSESKRLLTEALSMGHPSMIFLSPNTPVTPKSAIVATELFAYTSAAVTTPDIAVNLLGLDGITEHHDEITRALGEDEALCRMAALAEELARANDFVFSLIFDPEECRGILFSADAYDVIAAESIESAIAEIFRTA